MTVMDARLPRVDVAPRTHLALSVALIELNERGAELTAESLAAAAGIPERKIVSALEELLRAGEIKADCLNEELLHRVEYYRIQKILDDDTISMLSAQAFIREYRNRYGEEITMLCLYEWCGNGLLTLAWPRVGEHRTLENTFVEPGPFSGLFRS